MEVLKIIDIGHNAAGSRVVLQIVEHTVHLIHVPLGVVVLHGKLIAVGLADGASLVSPLVPDFRVQVMDVVGLLLPDPQQLVHRRFPVGPPQGQDGEFLLQVVAVHNAEFLDGVGGGAVLPVGADFPVGVPDAVFQNIPAIFNETDIGVAHGGSLLFSCHW